MNNNVKEEQGKKTKYTSEILKRTETNKANMF
jgi:hypothetical protein